MNVADELAVQSYCFRHFKDNARVAELVKGCGLGRIELCGVHVKWPEVDAFADVVRIYRDAGVEIVSIGVNGLAGDADAERPMFEFCREAGCGHMAVSFNIHSVPQCFEVAQQLAEEYDLRLGIHNHGGRHWLGCAETLNWVFENTGDRVGLCLDTAWALHSHEDPVAMVERFADRLWSVHIKDFTFDAAGNHTDVVVGTGNLDLPGLLAAMDAGGFDGFPALEYEGDVEDPVPALTKCVDAVRQAASD